MQRRLHPRFYIAKRLSELAPAFLADLRRLGAKYTYRYTSKQLVSNTGNSVRGAYGQHVSEDDEVETFRRKIETEVKRHSEHYEWHEDGSLSVTHVVPGDYYPLHIPSIVDVHCH